MEGGFDEQVNLGYIGGEIENPRQTGAIELKLRNQR